MEEKKEEGIDIRQYVPKDGDATIQVNAQAFLSMMYQSIPTILMDERKLLAPVNEKGLGETYEGRQYYFTENGLQLAGMIEFGERTIIEAIERGELVHLDTLAAKINLRGDDSPEPEQPSEDA